MRAKLLVMHVILAVVPAINVLPAALVNAATLDSHVVLLDSAGKIIPWTSDPALGYDQVMNLAWNYLLTGVPSDSQNGKPFYYSYSCMLPDTQQAFIWPHNPAGLYSMLTESALKYYGYSGNIAPVNLARDVATAMLANGMTPAGANWANVPYASGDAGSLTYQGAAFGNTTGQGDGTGVIQPDKVGEMGYAWLQLYRFDGNIRFRDAAIAAADALASHVRIGNATKSPWPFRVYAQTGVVREDYCANVIGPIRLFDGLISLGLGNTAVYQTARQTAWEWMMAYPMQNNVWANYFEDIPIQADTGNFTQYNAMMTARYLLEHPEFDPSWERHVRGLISWVESFSAIASYGANTITIGEQMQFLYPMGSHTSRYASVNALLFEATGDVAAREKAYRSLNWATYMARDNGIVIDGPDVPAPNHVWFTDGYGDYIRHFMTSMGAVPDWAPAGQNHLVRSSSVVKNISYLTNAVTYTSSDGASTEVLRTNFTPARVTVDGLALRQGSDLNQAGWTFDPNLKILRVRHDLGTNVLIASGTFSSITWTITTSTGTGFTITPATPQSVNNNATTSFSVIPQSGYGIVTINGCGGSYSGTMYTTGAITSNCTISVTAVARNASSGTSPTINDALKVFQAVAGITPLTATERIRYDVAPLSARGTPLGNGVTDAADVILILRRSIGIGSW